MGRVKRALPDPVVYIRRTMPKKPNPHDPPPPPPPPPPPSSGAPLIVYAHRPVPSVQDLWTVRIDGTEPKQRTSGGFDNSPCFAADGKSLVFSAARGQPHVGLWRLDLATGAITQIPTGTLYQSQGPVCTPDAIFFEGVETSTSKPGIFRVPLAGSPSPTRLTSATEYFGTPRVAAGRLFSIVGPGGAFASANLWVMNLDGSAPVPLTTNGMVTGRAAISPDGTVAFYQYPNGALVRHELATGVIVTLGVNVTDPDVSPDGTRLLACDASDYTNPDIALYDPVTPGPRLARVTSAAGLDTAPAWAPPGV